MITKSEWLEKLRVDPTGTLDLTLYNNMYGPISGIREWCEDDSSASFILDGALVDWQNSFWGILPKEGELRRRVAGAWSKALLLILDLKLPRGTRFLRDRHEERLYLHDLSKGRDLLGQYYEIMRADVSSDSLRNHWVKLATSTLDIPLGHREIAILALVELGDSDEVINTFRGMEAELQKIAKVSGKAEVKDINLFLRGLRSIISVKLPAFSHALAEDR